MFRINLLCVVLGLIKCISAGGTFKIALESYRFEVKLNQQEDTKASPSLANVVLADMDYVKAYSPMWKLKGMMEKVEDDTALFTPNDTSYEAWPWGGPTECFGGQTRFRFLLCLDFAHKYDPSRLCQLARIQSNLFDISRDRFSGIVLGRKNVEFGSILGILSNGDIITNPIELEFEDWNGPLRLAVYVSCCGGSRYITDRCGDVMSTSITIWPQSLAKGTRSMRYSLDGHGSLLFTVNANCDTDFYGKSCTSFCRIGNPLAEHAYCNTTTGEKGCMKGWKGLGCQIDVDECLGVVCKNGGTCKNSRGTFTCTCPFGTRGRQCERRYPICHLQPCQHQGTCLDTPAGALCFCMPGFDGQWCHLLEGEKRETSRMKTGQGSKTLANSSLGTVPVAPARTVMVRDTPRNNKSSSGWHDWYIGLIVGGFLLVSLLLVLLFIIYRNKVRQQYKVTVPENTLLPMNALPKTRVFGNGVYERDDESRIIQPSTFHIFYESKKITDIINNTNNTHTNNTNNNNNNQNKTSSKLNNSGVLLNAGALMQSRSDFESNDTKNRLGDGKDKLKASCHGATVKIDNKEKEIGVHHNSKSNDRGELRPYSVEKADNCHVSDEHDSPSSPSGLYKVPRNHGPIADRWQNIGLYSSPTSQCRSPRAATQGYSSTDYNEPRFASESSGVKGEERRDWHHGGSYVQYGASTNSRSRGKKRRSEMMGGVENEHEYEDIDSDHEFLSYRPTPKPRSVYNVRCETLKQRYAIPDEISGDFQQDLDQVRINLGQLSNRRSSDGMVTEAYSGQTLQQQRLLANSRFDQPRFSEGDIVYPQLKTKQFTRHDFNKGLLPLSLYVSPEEMALMATKSNQNPSQLKLIQTISQNIPKNLGDSSNERQISKRNHSPTGSPGNKLSFLSRPNSRHIYRNTDIEGFETTTNTNSRFSPKAPKSPRFIGESGSFRRKSMAYLAHPPKVDRRRRKSEVMSEKIFGRRISGELRSDSEASVDRCWWSLGDDVHDADVQDDVRPTVSSSAFV